ncbi:MAG: DUF4424 family protein, partial [Hyphomicrobiaceae bacterium]
GTETPAAAEPEASADTLELPAGGLVLIPDERIAVEAEEVVLSRSLVRVTYAVRSRSEAPLARIVSWPLPEIDANAIGDDVVVLPAGSPRDYSGVVVTVDGAAVPLSFEQRAVAFSRDLTVLLEAAGLPLNPLATGVEEALRSVPADRLAELEERGAIRRDDERLVPAWAVRTTAFWRQTFEPGRLLTIGLAYGPVTASGLWRPESLATLRETYCIDKGLEGAIAARIAKSPRGLVAHRLTYTMANSPGWSAPIPSFRLAIEKSGFETLIASCWEGLRVVGPTLVENVRRDFHPGDDIRVLFFQ